MFKDPKFSVSIINTPPPLTEEDKKNIATAFEKMKAAKEAWEKATVGEDETDDDEDETDDDEDETDDDEDDD
jgi:hypothetical protein